MKRITIDRTMIVNATVSVQPIASLPNCRSGLLTEKVGSAAIKGSTEPMRLDLHNKGDVRYQEGFVIAHNPDNQPGKGSCIFAHLWRQPGEATAGCTAMPQARMQALLDWLRPQDTPRFVLLPRAEYQRLQAQWQLPALSGDAR